MAVAVPRVVHRSSSCAAVGVADISAVSATIRIMAQRRSSLSGARRGAASYHCLVCAHSVAVQQRHRYSKSSSRHLDAGLRRDLLHDDARTARARLDDFPQQQVVLVDSPDDVPSRSGLISPAGRTLSLPVRRDRSQLASGHSTTSELIGEHRLVVAVPFTLKNFCWIESPLEAQEFRKLGIGRDNLLPVRPAVISEIVAPAI